MVENHWSTLRERGSLIGIKTLFTFYQYGGKYVALIILYPVIFYFFVTGRSSRLASLNYLRKLHQGGYLDKKPGLLMSFKHFLSMGISALDKVDVWLGNITFKDIKHINYHLFEPLLAQQQGALIIGSHLGNLEICRALSEENTAACFNVLVFTEHAQKFNDFLNTLNENVKINLIEVTQISPVLAILLKEKIEQGEYVVIAGDRTSTTVAGRVIYQDFLGQPAAFSQGPFILAGLMQCPVLIMFCLKEKNHYQLIFEPLSDGVKFTRKNRQAELTNLINIYANTLEKYCAKHPLQWFNFFDFWQRNDAVKSSNNKK
jgi:predicted LPLAT superfamily acyltransferase